MAPCWIKTGFVFNCIFIKPRLSITADEDFDYNKPDIVAHKLPKYVLILFKYRNIYNIHINEVILFLICILNWVKNETVYNCKYMTYL